MKRSTKRLLRNHRPGLGTAPHTGHSAGQRKLPGADEPLVPSRTKGGRPSKLKHPGAKHVGRRLKAGDVQASAFGRTALQAQETLDTGSQNRRNGRDKRHLHQLECSPHREHNISAGHVSRVVERSRTGTGANAQPSILLDED